MYKGGDHTHHLLLWSTCLVWVSFTISIQDVHPSLVRHSLNSLEQPGINLVDPGLIVARETERKARQNFEVTKAAAAVFLLRRIRVRRNYQGPVVKKCAAWVQTRLDLCQDANVTSGKKGKRCDLATLVSTAVQIKGKYTCPRKAEAQRLRTEAAQLEQEQAIPFPT